jgi:hypothetical protein
MYFGPLNLKNLFLQNKITVSAKIYLQTRTSLAKFVPIQTVCRVLSLILYIENQTQRRKGACGII